MRVIGRDKLETFCAKHADARRWIENWLADAEVAVWNVPQQIRNRYPSASFLAENRVIFNVKGNDYRLEVLVAYRPPSLLSSGLARMLSTTLAIRSAKWKT